MTTKRPKPSGYEFRMLPPGEPLDMAAAIRRLERAWLEGLLREYLSIKASDGRRNGN